MPGIPTWAEPTPYTSGPWPHTEGKSSAHCVIPSPQPMAASEPSSVLYPRTLRSPWLPASQAQHCIPVLSTAHGCQRAKLDPVFLPVLATCLKRVNTLPTRHAVHHRSNDTTAMQPFYQRCICSSLTRLEGHPANHYAWNSNLGRTHTVHIRPLATY